MMMLLQSSFLPLGANLIAQEDNQINQIFQFQVLPFARATRRSMRVCVCV